MVIETSAIIPSMCLQKGLHLEPSPHFGKRTRLGNCENLVAQQDGVIASE